MPELISDGENGLLFEAGNVEDLVSKIEDMEARNKDEIIEIGRNRRMLLEKRNSKEKYIEEIEEIYKSFMH